MLQYPWNDKNNTFTWPSSLYNPFKSLPNTARGPKKVHTQIETLTLQPE